MVDPAWETSKDDPVQRFNETECVDCGERAVLDGHGKFNYWLSWAWEEGHIGDDDHLWLNHRDWRCPPCSKEFHLPEI